MRPIPEATWANAFKGEDGRYDGRKFEKLASALLRELYGPGWEETAKSHDGSRDFEKREGSKVLWAECKAYSQRLSIYVLSPTLVMALLDDADIVIVLSRSSLNKNAIWHLARYQTISSKTICCYDGSSLDQAIISTGLLSRFFPVTQLAANQSSLEILSSVTTDALAPPVASDFDPTTRHTKEASRAVPIFGLVRIDVLVRNLAPRNASQILISVPSSTLHPSLKVVSFCGAAENRTQEVYLEAGSLFKAELILQPTRPAKNVTLPVLEVSQEGQGIRRINSGEIQISHLYQTSIIGYHPREILSRASAALSERRALSVISIEGSSGTGKTRLLQEIAISGLEAGLACFRYDPEFEDPQAGLTTLRGLIGDLCELPAFSLDFDKQDTEITFPKGPSGILARALYDNTFPVWENINTLVPALLQHLGSRRILLSFDNLQFADDHFIQFLEVLLTHSQTSPRIRLALVLGFNTDFERKGSRVETLRQRLRAYSADSSRSQTYFHCHLEDFTRRDVVEFVERALAPPGDTEAQLGAYNSTLDLLLEWVQPRPLNLWQSLMYLADQRVLRLVADRLMVTGEQTLLSRVQKLPASLTDILELRWRRLRENVVWYGVGPQDFRSTLLAAYVLGVDHPNRLIALGASKDGLEACHRAGLLALDARGRVKFFHSQLFLFFQRKFYEFSEPVAQKLKAGLEAEKLSTIKFQQYFILRHYSNEVTGALLSATVGHLEKRGVTPEYWRQYTDTLASYLMDPARALGPTVLRGMKLISEWQQRLNSLRLGAGSLEAFFAERLLAVSRRQLPGISLLQLYQVAINVHLAIFEDLKALELIDLALTDLEEVQFRHDRDRDIARAAILNRKAATLKNFASFDDALTAGLGGLAQLSKWKCHSLEVETLFDLGGLLRRAPDRRREARSYFEQGLSIFESHEAEMEEPASCRFYFVKGLLALEDEEFFEAMEILDRGTRHCRGVQNHFWTVRTLSLETAGRLLWSEDRVAELERIKGLLIEAQDLANTAQARRSSWVLSFLAAEMSTRRGDFASAARLLKEAIRDLCSNLRYPEQAASRREVFLDMACLWRRYNLEVDLDMVRHIPNEPLQHEMELIVAMKEGDFVAMEDLRRARGLLRHGSAYMNIY